MKSVGMTHLGLVRKNNQDNFLSLNHINGYHIFAVADGLGGHNAGEVASDYAVKQLAGYFNARKGSNFLENTEEIVLLIKNINNDIYAMANKSANLSGMGTTLTLIVADGMNYVTFHVGDSRAYLIRDKIKQITKDHSLVQYMVDQGQITKEEADNHPQKNIITRALGTDEDVHVDVIGSSMKTGDILLICSDGLTNNVSDEKIKEIVKHNTIENAVKNLIEEANRNGGSDNITVVLFAEAEDNE